MKHTGIGLEKFIQSFYVAMLTYATRSLGNIDDAYDVVQDVCLNLWRKRDVYACYNNIAALCYKMVQNGCIDRLRAVKSLVPDTALYDHVDKNDPAAQLEREETRTQLCSLLSTLPHEHSKAFIMRMQGYEFEEIAAATGLEQGNIRVIISRVRKHFRRSVEVL